jgi:hypothetical protein
MTSAECLLRSLACGWDRLSKARDSESAPKEVVTLASACILTVALYGLVLWALPPLGRPPEDHAFCRLHWLGDNEPEGDSRPHGSRLLCRRPDV